MQNWLIIIPIVLIASCENKHKGALNNLMEIKKENTPFTINTRLIMWFADSLLLSKNLKIEGYNKDVSISDNPHDPVLKDTLVKFTLAGDTILYYNTHFNKIVTYAKLERKSCDAFFNNNCNDNNLFDRKGIQNLNDTLYFTDDEGYSQLKLWFSWDSAISLKYTSKYID